MKHPLNIDSFEQFFNEKILKKGLSFFERRRFKTIEKHEGGEYVFIFKGKKAVELVLKKKRNKISDYTCSCKNENNCEHLCAAIFYLTKDELFLSKTKKQKRSEVSKKKGDLLFNQSCNKLKSLRERFSETFPAKKGGADDKTFEIIKTFIDQSKKGDPVLTHLSIINEFSNVLPVVKSINGEEINLLLQESVKYLKNLRFDGLSDVETEAWISAAKNALKNNVKFNSAAFTFLIPVAANIINEIEEFDELKISLGKRYLKPNYPHYLDLKLIAQLQLQIKEAELLKKSDSLFLKDLSPELAVARAELKFYSNRIKTGFKILTNDYERIKKFKPANFVSYIQYIIEKAKEFKNSETEAVFIKEIMIFDSQISPRYLKRLKEIMPQEQREEYVDDIIKELKKKSAEIYFDKVSQILESEDRLDEVVVLISKQTNKFSLINRIAIKKLPLYDDFLLTNYIKHFAIAVSEARETFHQKQIYDKALVYLEQLPKEVLEKTVLQMLDKISRSNFVFRHLKKLVETFQSTEDT